MIASILVTAERKPHALVAALLFSSHALNFSFPLTERTSMLRGYAGSFIGIDLDNTLVCYDELFLELAVARDLVPANFRGTKREVRDRIRRLPDGELAWRRLQAQAYGPAISGARPAAGALEFIARARRHGARLAIVSHKTQHSNLAGETVNLHAAARAWLYANGIIGDSAIGIDDVYFEATREKKILRISSLACTHFIDDLEEVLGDAMFPPDVVRMLYAARHEASGAYAAYATFGEIARAFEG